MSYDAGKEDEEWAAVPVAPPRAAGITVRAGGCAIAVRTDGQATMHWLLSYLAGFWRTEREEADAAHTDVVAMVDRQARQRLCALVDRSARAGQVRMFMGATGLRLTSPGPRVLAGCPDQRVAFARDGTRITVVADDRDALGPATVRVVREAAGAWLEAAGWAQVHAAGAVRGESGILAFGPKGAGKTAAVMALTAHGGWRLLAHDRAYISLRAGQPCVLPWPSSLNIGIGLLAALGWADTVRARYRAGQRPPYHQKEAVTAALVAGRSTAVRQGRHELKAQLLPSQVTEWFGVPLARSAALAAVVFPHADLDRRQPQVQPLDRAAFSGADVFPPRADIDYFPDFLCLTGRSAADRSRSALAALHAVGGNVPAYRLRLGRDIAANAAALAGLIR